MNSKQHYKAHLVFLNEIMAWVSGLPDTERKTTWKRWAQKRIYYLHTKI